MHPHDDMSEATIVTAAASGTFMLGGDLPVHRLGFGALWIAGPSSTGEPRDPQEARRVLQRVVELGVNLIDTANSYGPEVSERYIGETLYPYPKDLVIATKGGVDRSRSTAWPPDGRPDHLRQACESSLKRLRRDRIDLYQLHTIDPRVPLEDSIGALVDLQREGKIRHIGVSNFEVEELQRAMTIARVVSVQNRLNLADRSSDDVLQECERLGIAFLPWRPLATDGLARRNSFVAIAKRHHATPAQVVIAWLLRRSTVMLPIPGTSSVRHLEENVAAAGIELSDSDVHEMNVLGGRYY
jgi:pyridoxine 4-dehydrogenase